MYDNDHDTRDTQDDLIGSASIDIGMISKNEMIHNKFIVRDSRKKEVGSIEVRISTEELNEFNRIRQEREFSYTQEWEENFIRKIAIEMARKSENNSVDSCFN
jgi:hypothetical protein